MATIAVLITDMFEDVEYTKPADAFQKAGHHLIHVGLKEGATVTGKKEQTPVKIDRSVANAAIKDFDALFIPGGYSPDRLRIDANAVRLAGDFLESDKPVLAICHAAQLLITADVIRDRRVTGYKSIEQDIKNAGAHFLDQEVVVDRNLVSSRNPGDIPMFIEACLDKLK
jgi:protease I